MGVTFKGWVQGRMAWEGVGSYCGAILGLGRCTVTIVDGPEAWGTLVERRGGGRAN